MRIQIKKFNPVVQLTQTATVLLIGKRGSGKSTLMRDLMFHMKDALNFGLAMSPTEESTASLGTFIPRSCIYNNFSSTALDVMLEIQRKSVKAGKWKQMYLIMDDCMYDKKVMKGVNIRELFMNGRHRKIFHMNAIQYLMDIGPDIRSQVDFVFALKENIVNNREKLWKFFFGMFENFSDFNKVMSSCTNGYDAIVLDNTKRSNELSECVFWYTANPATPEFTIGDRIFWQLDRYYFKDKEDERHTTLGVTNTSCKKEGIHIIERADSQGHILLSATND